MRVHKIAGMKKWVLKAIVQKGISWLPYKHRLNYLFQKYVTRGVQLSDAYFEDKLIHFQQHEQVLEHYQGPILGKTFLELGTGWYPVVPICLFLRGADKVHTIDISRLTTAAKIHETLQQFVAYAERNQLLQYLKPLPERWAILQQWAARPTPTAEEPLLQDLNLRYHVRDARQIDLPNHHVHGILSNNTFEHIYPDILKGILLEFKRILAKGGVMCHFIDMSDHFAHLDHSITIYNFLRYSKPEWQRIDNTIQPQNRWRLPDYQQLYDELDIPIQETLDRPGSLDDLARVPVHADFQQYTLKELAISHSYVVSVL